MNQQQSNKTTNINLLLLWLGQLVSQFGSQITAISLIYWLKDQIGLASVMGLSTMLFSIFIAMFSPLGGALADIYSRKTIIVACDIAAGTVSLLLPFLLYWFPEQLYLLIGSVLFMQVILGATLGLYDPAYSALLANVVPPKKLPLANGIKNAIIQCAVLIGQGAGFLLYGKYGIIAILLANSGSFFISAFSESRIKVPKTAEQGSLPSPEKNKIGLSMKQGLAFIRQNSSLKSLLILVGGVNCFAGPFVVLLPFFVEQSLEVEGYWYGYLIAGFGAGGLLGYLSLPLLKNKIENWSAFSQNSYLLFGTLLMGLGLNDNIYLTLLLFTLAGTCFGLVNIIIETALLANTPDGMRGRVMSIYRVVTRLALPLGMMVAGLLVDFLDQNINIIFIVSGFSVIVLSLQQFKGEKLKAALTLTISTHYVKP